jgi:hypothetical protein
MSTLARCTTYRAPDQGPADLGVVPNILNSNHSSQRYLGLRTEAVRSLEVGAYHSARGGFRVLSPTGCHIGVAIGIGPDIVYKAL